MLMALSEGISQERFCCLGVNIYGLAKGKASIHSGLAFAGHWSISSDISIGYARFKRAGTDIGAVHDSEFSESEPEISRPPDLIAEHISFRYWINRAMQGAFLATGIRCGSTTGIDYTIGIGYEIPIWKRLHVTARYTYALKNMTTDRNTGLEGMDICLSCTF